MSEMKEISELVNEPIEKGTSIITAQNGGKGSSLIIKSELNRVCPSSNRRCSGIKWLSRRPDPQAVVKG
jgi:hypothetical protein